MPELLVWREWCEPVMRGDLKLATGDVQEAINDHELATGHRPSVIALCPKNERFRSEVPPDIEVEISKRAMLWGIMTAGDGTTNPHQDAPAKQQAVSKPKRVYCHHPASVTHKILEMVTQKLSTRQIANEMLQKYGIEVSHMTVARRLKAEATRGS